MINGFIKGQALTLSSPVIASGTIDYLTARFTFFTNEWEHLNEIWVHFRQGDKVFDAQVVDGRVKENEHINLTEGEWSVYLHGNTLENGEVKRRITTEPQTVKVVATGNLEGEPFPSVDASTAEKLLAIAKEAEEKADKAIEAVADVQIQKGVQSLTAFPEIAKEGDVVLLHRCNEITADDSNSGVVIDVEKVISLGLPEGYDKRYWTFEATESGKQKFQLWIDIQRIQTAESYVLTCLYIIGETVGGKWYWKDGELTTDIPDGETSLDNLPKIVPLGKIDAFASSRTLYNYAELIVEDDKDESVVFRTLPLHYIFSDGWQLAEGSGVADGAIIGNVQQVEKEGNKFLRLRLIDSHDLRLAGEIPQYIDIPVSSIKEVTEQSGNITLNGSEVIFPNPEPENTEEIPLVTELPENAEFGDMCLYARANTFTTEDTGTTIYINPEWLNNVSANRQRYVWEIGISDYSLLFTITVSVTETTASFDAYTYGTGEQWGYHLYFKRDATENLVLNTKADNHYSDENGKVTLTEMPKSLKIPQFEATRIINPDCPFTLFYHEPELMIYRDEWVEQLSADDIEHLEESSHSHANAETLENFTEDADGNLLYKGESIGSEGLSAYFDGDTLVLSATVVNEIERMIDESGVLDE